MLKKIKKMFTSPSFNEIKNDDRVKNAIDFQNKFKPKEDKNYDWVYNLSLQELKDTNEIIKSLEDKADRLIKYLTPIFGFISFAMGFLSLNVLNKELFLVLVGSGIVFFILAIIFSAIALRPQTEVVIPSFAEALEITDAYISDVQARARYVIGINVTRESQLRVSQDKSDKIEYSYWCFIIGLLWMFIIAPVIYFAFK